MHLQKQQEITSNRFTVHGISHCHVIDILQERKLGKKHNSEQQ